MRSWILALFVSITVAAPAAQAMFFPVNPYVQTLPATVSAQVYNPYYEPMLCQGYVYGTTLRGFTMNAYFNSVVPAGQYRYAYVYVNNPYLDRFAHGWAQIHCRFFR